MELQLLQIYGVQFSWDTNADPDTFKRFSVAFSRAQQHSNGRHCNIHYFNYDSGIDCDRCKLCNGRLSSLGLELLAEWDTGSGHNSARGKLGYGNIDGVERGKARKDSDNDTSYRIGL